MVTENIIDKIYDAVINDIELTTKELNSYGLNSRDINTLINQDIIRRKKRGFYEISNINFLYNYSRKLLKQKKYEKSQKCFEKILKINPNHFETNFDMFCQSICKDNYEDTYKYFDRIISTTSKFYHTDYNIYLYLLNFITEVPQKYARYTSCLRLEDLIIDEKDFRYSDVNKYNNVINAMMQRKFSYALHLLNNIIEEKKYKTRQDIIIINLLYDVFMAEKEDKNNILNYVKEKDYDSIIKILDIKSKKVGLSFNEEIINILASDIKYFKNNKYIPKPLKEERFSFREAIDNYNYELALNIRKEYIETYNISCEEDSIYLLLNEICILKKELCLHSNKTIELEDDTKKEETVSVAKKEEIGNVTLNDVLNSLMANDLEKNLVILKDYMLNINKEEYIFLIIRLIKLSILKNDFAFITPMTTLTLISRNAYTFDVSYYIQEFYLALSLNHLEEAEIYLDIIRNANNIKLSNTNIENLEKVLNINKETKEQLTVSSNENTEEKIEKNSNIIPEKTSTNFNLEKKFLDDRYKYLLSNKGIVLLKPMDKDRRRVIHKLVETYPYMESFSIGKDNNRRIVLKYINNEELLNINETIELGKIAYINKNYKKCIEYYEKLLNLKKGKAFVYSKLGFAYMKLRQRQKAIEYFTVAIEMNKEENNDKAYDLEDLLLRLQGLVLREDKKPRFNMKEEDFIEDADLYYGIENIEEITEYVKNSNKNVNIALKELNLSEEQINIIKLIYARGFYINQQFEIGDSFIKDVEQSKNKSDFILKLLEEIRKNKKLYFNRNKDKILSLSLKMKP